MDFRTSATKELSAVLDRLIQAAESAAVAARVEAAAEAQLTIDAVNAQRTTVQQALQEKADAHEMLQRAHATLEADQTDLQQQAAALRARIESLTAEADTMRAHIESLTSDADAMHAHIESLTTDANTMRAHIESLTTEANTRAAIAETLRAEVAELRAESAVLRAEGNALRAESETERHDLRTQMDEAHRAAVEATARAAAARDEQVRTIRDQAVALVSRTLDRLVAVSAAFSHVSTEDEVLAAVVEALATEFPRVALFKLGLNRLDAIRHVGFAFPSDYTHLVIPQAVGAVLDRAVTSGQVETLPPDVLAALAGTAFGGSSACAMALPIDLEGDACAVLYADDADQPAPPFGTFDLRRSFAVLLRHIAAPLLQRFPAEMKAIAELREYAAHLVAELENMYAADVSAHRRGSDLRQRLQDNLECARGIYAQRVSSEAPAAALLLEEELALAASVAHATPFGRDLTALLRAREPRAAEA